MTNAAFSVNDSRKNSVLMTEQEAAQYLGLSRAALRKWRLNGSSERSQVPPFVQVGSRNVRYSIAALDNWIAARSVQR
jgi:excisionase family DNA binding protein